jgi:hypothetical protein
LLRFLGNPKLTESFDLGVNHKEKLHC